MAALRSQGNLTKGAVIRTRPAIVTAAFVLAAIPLSVPAQGFVPTKPVEFATHTGVGAGFDVPSMPLFRGVVAPPDIPREAVTYWEGVFARMVKTPALRKYLDDNVLEDGFQRSAAQAKFFDEYADAMRAIFQDGGIKVVR